MRRPWHEAASKAASAPTGLRLPCYAQEHFLLERKNQKPLAENRHLHKNQDTTAARAAKSAGEAHLTLTLTPKAEAEAEK